jgi:hypothetical protein
MNPGTIVTASQEKIVGKDRLISVDPQFPFCVQIQNYPAKAAGKLGELRSHRAFYKDHRTRSPEGTFEVACRVWRSGLTELKKQVPFGTVLEPRRAGRYHFQGLSTLLIVSRIRQS